MRVLLVDDCLSTDFIVVTKENRPVQTSEPAIFAVVTEMGVNGLFCGLVTSEEINFEKHSKFGEILEGKEIQLTTLGATVYQALIDMDHEHLRVLPVLNETGKLVGIITQQNIVLALSRHESDYLTELRNLNSHVKELEKNATTRIKRLVQLDETTRNLLSSLGLTLIETNTLQMCIDALTTLMRVRYGAIGILDQADQSGKTLKYFVHTGVEPQLSQTIGSPPTRHGLLGAVIKENVSLRLEDISKDPRSVGFPPSHPAMKSLLAVPISFGADVYGQLYLSEKINGLPFSEDDAWLCQNFSSSLGNGLNKLTNFGADSKAPPQSVDLKFPKKDFP